MSEEQQQFDNVTEICLPAKFLSRSVGVAFDVGKWMVYLHNKPPIGSDAQLA